MPGRHCRSGRHVFPYRPHLCTSLGTFNTLPATAQSIIPPYDYDNPGQFTFNLRLSKTFSFGKETQRAVIRRGVALAEGAVEAAGVAVVAAAVAWAAVSGLVG